MTTLLDGNVLVALMLSGHTHHRTVRAWFVARRAHPFATCATTQGTLLRLHMQLAVDTSATAAWSALAALCRHPCHEFWPDALPYHDVDITRIQGPRQVTDAWLAQLARSRSARLATLDTAFARLHSDVAELISS